MSRAAITEALTAAGQQEHVAAVLDLLQPAVWIHAEKLADRPPNAHAEGGDEEDEAEGEAGAEGEDHEGAAGASDAAARTEARFRSLDDALAALPLGASRFGGVPDLPPGVDWPARDDVPMEFVAQLRLADLPVDPLGRLPTTGHLWFFYNSQWLTFDQDQDHACCAVIYRDVADGELVRQVPPRVDYQGEYDSAPRLAPYVHGLASLRFTACETVPGGVSPWIAGTPLEAFWQDFTAGGHPALQPEGDATYQSNRVLGYVDAQDYVDAHQHGTDDQLLLQVDSDDAASFQWGDCDRLYFMISKAALAARDFAQVRLYSILG